MYSFVIELKISLVFVVLCFILFKVIFTKNLELLLYTYLLTFF